MYTFDPATGNGSWVYRNATLGRSPWAKMGRATAGLGERFAVFAGGNGNCHNIELYDAVRDRWFFAPVCSVMYCVLLPLTLDTPSET